MVSKNLDRQAMLKELNEFKLNYLLYPDYIINSKYYDNHLHIEHTLIKTLVKSSLHPKNLIDTVLQQEYTKGETPILPELAQPYQFEVKQIKEAKKSQIVSNKNYDFLISKLRLFLNTIDYVGDTHYKNTLISEILNYAIGYTKQLEDILASEKQNYQKLKLEDDPSDKSSEIKDNVEKVKNSKDLQLKKLNSRVNGLIKQLELPRLIKNFIVAILDEYAITNISLVHELTIGILLTDKKLSQKVNDMLINLVFWGLVPDQEILLSEPFETCFNHDPDSEYFTLNEVEALKELYTNQVFAYFSTKFVDQLKTLPKRFQTDLFDFFEEAGLKESIVDSHALVDYLLRQFRKLQSQSVFEEEIKHIHKQFDESFELKPRQVLLIGGKRKLDQFYGWVGEHCLYYAYKEIDTQAFTPIRIIDLDKERLVGYIHFLLFDLVRHIDHTDERIRLVMIAGIEPKTSWLSHLDGLDFYKQCSKGLEYYCKQLDVDILCNAADFTALSNNIVVYHALRNEMLGKPVIKPFARYKFPSTTPYPYDFSSMVVLWYSEKIANNQHFLTHLGLQKQAYENNFIP